METQSFDPGSGDSPAIEASGNPQYDALADFRSKIQGKDRALSLAKAEHERFREAVEAEKADQAATLARTKAELEEANAALSVQYQQAQAELAAAKAEALRYRFPNAAAVLDGAPAEIGPDVYERLEAVIGSEEPIEREPFVQSNNPRRIFGAATEKPLSQMSSDELVNRLANMKDWTR